MSEWEVGKGALQAISVALSLLSIHSLGERRRHGWLAKAAGQLTAIPLNFMSGLYLYGLLCVVRAVMSLWSWRKWGLKKHRGVA